MLDEENEQHFEPEVSHPKYKRPRPLANVQLENNGHELVWLRHRFVNLMDHSPVTNRFRNQQVHHRAAECKRALDFLERLNLGEKMDNLLGR